MQIAAAVQQQRRLVMAHLNVHGLAQLYESPAMTALLKLSETLIMIDSMPILFAANLLGIGCRGRSGRRPWISMTECSGSARLGWRFCYVGAEPRRWRRASPRCVDRFAGLDIEGRHGYFDMDDVSDGSRQDEILAWLRARSSDILIVGMGMQGQEVVDLPGSRRDRCASYPDRWRLYRLSGGYPVAAAALARSGRHRWAYRLARAPRRLWRRYLVEPLVLYGGSCAVASQSARLRRIGQHDRHRRRQPFE